MEIADFARHILFDAPMAAKLFQPTEFTDLAPGAGIVVPAAPARETALVLPARGAAVKTRFPTPRQLEEDVHRATVLHFFANHELLALELMALALLRFPEAPAKFRRGLVGTMLEEQKHLRLYCQRMGELGLDFGAVPVNGYFWEATAGMASPLEFVTQMSLTLEQANLDFSWHFLQVFRDLGDEPTAAIMEVVYQEEIGHVGHGVAWFNRWRPEGESDWEAYRRLLPLPLTPARAKGIGYCREPRRAAGLSEAFVTELAVYRHSKGRPPALYWFNPAFEDEVANGRASYVPAQPLAQLTADLSSLLMFVAHEDDVLLVPQRPTTAWLDGMQALGMTVPQFAVGVDEVAGRYFERLAPWGRSPAALAQAERLAVRVRQELVAVPDAAIFSKAWAKELLQRALPEYDLGGGVYRSVETAIAAALDCQSRGQVVLKAALGSSGRNMIRLRPGEDFNDRYRGWVRNVIAAQGAVIVEPWRHKVADFSMQLNVGTGERTYAGLTRFLTDGRGQYTGHVLGRKLAGLKTEIVRAYHEDDYAGRLEKTVKIVEQALLAAGYIGPAGIDALVYEDGGRYHLYALVEVNVRLTMGRVALGLDRHVAAPVAALWLHLSRKQVAALGYQTFPDFVAAMQRAYPLERRQGLLVSGAVATVDPGCAQVMLPMLFAGDAAVQAFTSTAE